MTTPAAAPRGVPADVVVELAGISKRFPGVVANRDVSLVVRKGEVHAVVGENGAGKSTLMKILYGMQKPDDGTITVDGAPVRFGSPADAIAAGIGMVHQHFMLVPVFTVAENVMLGREQTRGLGVLDRGAAADLVRGLSSRYNLAVDPGGPPCHCGQRGCVEQFASATAVERRYGRGTARDAFEAARRGDPRAVAAVDWACDGLAAGVANVIHVLQPDVVVLAGGMAAAGEPLIERVRAGVRARVRPGWLATVRVELTSLGSDAGWVGAALWAAHDTAARAADPAAAVQ